MATSDATGTTDEAAELKRVVAGLKRSLSMQVAENMHAEGQLQRCKAELLDARAERQEAAKRAASLEDQLEMARSGHELNSRIRAYFGHLPEAELRAQISRRTTKSSADLERMNRMQLIDALHKCFHKAPREGASGGGFQSGIYRLITSRTMLPAFVCFFAILVRLFPRISIVSRAALGLGPPAASDDQDESWL